MRPRRHRPRRAAAAPWRGSPPRRCRSRRGRARRPPAPAALPPPARRPAAPHWPRSATKWRSRAAGTAPHRLRPMPARPCRCPAATAARCPAAPDGAPTAGSPPPCAGRSAPRHPAAPAAGRSRPRRADRRHEPPARRGPHCPAPHARSSRRYARARARPASAAGWWRGRPAVAMVWRWRSGASSPPGTLRRARRSARPRQGIAQRGAVQMQHSGSRPGRRRGPHASFAHMVRHLLAPPAAGGLAAGCVAR